jgi:RNA polymerase sigma-70 factor (ECF subfamily)
LVIGQATEALLKGLVDAARHGDPDAPTELVRVTWTGTYTLAYRLTGNEQDALDVTQETYLRALRGLPRFRCEARFSTWLYRVTANCASDHVAGRRRSRHDQLDSDGIDEARLTDRRSEHDPEACAYAQDERAMVAEALLRLPWKLRQVVVLRDIYDLSHKSIAAELGTSEAAAKVRLQRARKRLREDLGRRLHKPEGPRSDCPGSGDPGQRRRKMLGRKARRGDGTRTAGGEVVGMDDDAVAS